VAGISSAYALQKRTPGQYIQECVKKLLLSLRLGLLVLVPTQTYFAESFLNGYTGSYWRQCLLFFTKPTDLTSCASGFTPAHAVAPNLSGRRRLLCFPSPRQRPTQMALILADSIALTFLSYEICKQRTPVSDFCWGL